MSQRTIKYDDICAGLVNTPVADYLDNLTKKINESLDIDNHGDLSKWYALLNALPQIEASSIELNASSVRIGKAEDCNAEMRMQLKHSLRSFHPWRKGPFELFGINIDTEWRSDWKWNRLKAHIQPLNGRHVLDIGCGNGYHCWRMAGEGACTVIGIDPTLIYMMQYLAIRFYCSEIPVYVLPLGIDDFPVNLNAFDTVFSMGVLYHRRSPLDHLYQLRNCLRSGGELVLETLVIEGEEGQILLPKDRYAKMRNVWFIPSCPTLKVWLKRCGFQDIRIIDISKTTKDEQRSTEWMTFKSLSDFLDPYDAEKTMEGYPAPKRAIVLANRGD